MGLRFDIIVDPHLGTHIIDLLKLMYDLSTKYNCCITAKFNGKLISFSPIKED